MGRKPLYRKRFTARIDPDTYQTIERMAKARGITMGQMLDRITEYTYRRSRLAEASGTQLKM